MRELTKVEVVEELMKSIGQAVTEPTNVYFTGGVTAIFHGWRETTIDVDFTMIPESDALLKALPELKERLRVNIELAAPHHFIPALPGWRERSLFIAQHGTATFLHYDLYAQALSKIERWHRQDALDVHRMLDSGLIEPQRLQGLFSAIEPELYRYPAIDAAQLRSAVKAVLSGA
ncbi:MAG: DUF6036 family nucleotidyltransferase [Actinomycetota bacterium]